MKKDLRRADARTKFEEYTDRARRIYALVGQGRQVVKSTELAEMTDMSDGMIGWTARMLQELRVLAFTSKRGSTSGATWEFLTDWAGVKQALDHEMEREMRGAPSIREVARIRRTRPKRVTGRAAERVAVTTDRDGDPVAATVGPDAPNRVAPQVATGGSRGPEALVMAAKQYRQRRSGNDTSIQQARRLIKELDALGINAPDDLRAKAEAEPDDRLEAILLVLPYIERMERELAELARLRVEVNQVGPLKQQIERQRKQIEGLVSGRVADAMRPNLSTEH